MTTPSDAVQGIVETSRPTADFIRRELTSDGLFGFSPNFRDLAFLVNRSDPSDHLIFHFNPTEYEDSEGAKWESVDGALQPRPILEWKGGTGRTVRTQILLDDLSFFAPREGSSSDPNARLWGQRRSVGKSVEWLQASMRPAQRLQDVMVPAGTLRPAGTDVFQSVERSQQEIDAFPISGVTERSASAAARRRVVSPITAQPGEELPRWGVVPASILLRNPNARTARPVPRSRAIPLAGAAAAGAFAGQPLNAAGGSVVDYFAGELLPEQEELAAFQTQRYFGPKRLFLVRGDRPLFSCVIKSMEIDEQLFHSEATVAARGRPPGALVMGAARAFVTLELGELILGKDDAAAAGLATSDVVTKAEPGNRLLEEYRKGRDAAFNLVGVSGRDRR